MFKVCITHLFWIVTTCSSLLGCSNDDAISLTREGQDLFAEKRYDEALEFFDKALKKNPKHTDAILAKGRVFEEQEKFDQAIELYERALRLNPRHVAANMITGNAYRRKGDLPTAIEYVTKASQLSPGEAWIQNILGKVYLQSGDLVQAEDAMAKAVKLISNDAEFRFDLAQLYDRLNKRELALNEYRVTVQLLEGLERHRDTIEFSKKRIADLTDNH